MIELLNWLQVHWADIVAVYGGLVVVASIITKLTPTRYDDDFLLKVIKFVAKYLAINDPRPHEEIRDLQK